MNKSLSSTDIYKALDKKAKIISYDKVHNYNTIENLIGKNKYCVILYYTMDNYGHWICLIEHDDRIEFFDSTGAFPDSELDDINNKVNNKYHQNHTYIAKLLSESKLPIEYNHYKLQKISPKISTCGRWCIIRIILRDLNLEDFVKLLDKIKKNKKLKTYDDVVLYLTEKYI